MGFNSAFKGLNYKTAPEKLAFLHPS